MAREAAVSGKCSRITSTIMMRPSSWLVDLVFLKLHVQLSLFQIPAFILDLMNMWIPIIKLYLYETLNSTFRFSFFAQHWLVCQTSHSTTLTPIACFYHCYDHCEIDFGFKVTHNQFIFIVGDHIWMSMCVFIGQRRASSKHHPDPALINGFSNILLFMASETDIRLNQTWKLD